MVGYIYCITNAINGKQYVGKTLSAIEKRFKEHCNDATKRNKTENRPLYKAMNKYGFENFEISLLEEVAISRLDERESYWIEKLGTYHNGYNATLGGDGKVLYDEYLFDKDFANGMTIVDISKKYNCDVITVKTRLSSHGFDTSINGKKHNEEARKPVDQYDLNGSFIQTFSLRQEAAKYLIDNSESQIKRMMSLAYHIQEAANGKRKTCCGYVWKNHN